jgi:hypothetical protein
MPASHFDVKPMTGRLKFIVRTGHIIYKIVNKNFILVVFLQTIMILRCDQLKNKSSRRVTYGNPCYSIGSKANSIYFLNIYIRIKKITIKIRNS